MTSKEAHESLSKPQLERLKALGTGIKIGSVVGSRLLISAVKPFTEQDRIFQSTGLVAPDSVKEKYQPLETTGVVVAMGHTALYDPMNQDAETGQPIITEGSMVCFSKFAGSEIASDNESFRIIELKEVLCTLLDTKGVVAPVVEDPLRPAYPVMELTA